MRENMALLMWLETAVSGIRFGPDRKAAQAELYAHLEDRTLGLLRAFPDMDPDEARDRALAEMGDAEEVRRELAKVHRPWLGWLWMISRWALVLVLFVNLLVGREDHNSIVDYSIWGRIANETVYHRIRDGEKAELGGYTFQITGAAYVDRPEKYGAEDGLQLVLRASTLRFWERIDEAALLNNLYVARPDGERYCMASWLTQDYTVTDELGGVTTRRVSKSGGGLCRWGLGWKEFSLYVPAEGWQPGDEVTLSFTSQLGGFTLSAPVTEKVVVP